MFVYLLFAMPTAYGQSSIGPTGSICGTALDEKGAPAAFVKVVAIYDGAFSGIRPADQTDKFGHYCVANLAPGDYFMSAEDPEKGYPQMQSIFYGSPSAMPKASVAAKNPQGHADWQIPYKAGFLKVHLTDARTGKQIIPMFFNLVLRARQDVGFVRGSCASTIPLLVPPNEDIYFTVNAPGYQEWPGDGTKGRLLNLLQGATEDFAIALQPINP
jgi:hypothetical protein